MQAGFTLPAPGLQPIDLALAGQGMPGKLGAVGKERAKAASQSFEAVLERVLKNVRPEKRSDFLQALAPEPEQRLAGLAPEQRLAGLEVQQILDGLSPEIRAALVERLKH